MSNILFIRDLGLQIFAEGGTAGGTGAPGANGEGAGVPGPQSGVKSGNPLANVKYGIQDGDDSGPRTADATEVADAETRRVAEFERLIKTDYKDLYDARMQDTIQRRLKSSKETVDKYNALIPTLELLGKKYGVDFNDAKALTSAIEEDDSYYEDEALEKGLTVEQLKSIRKMERENADLKRQMDEQRIQENANRLYAEWMNQSQALKQVYPSFDLNTELQNPRFTDLLRNNVDVRTAYEVIHKDEIIPAAMQFTANQVSQKIANNLRANNSRPVENGIGSQASALIKSDVSQLSKEDRAEIIRRVARGEKIRF